MARQKQRWARWGLFAVLIALTTLSGVGTMRTLAQGEDDGNLLFQGVASPPDDTPPIRQPPVFGTTWTVNDLGDAGDAALNGLCATAGGVCTLRAAIQEANNNVDVDTINFSVSGTIVLTAVLPNITTSMTIDNTGGAQTLAIQGTNTQNQRLFNVTTGANFTLRGVSLFNADGSVWNTSTGTVTIEGVDISNNDIFTSAVSNTNAAGTMIIRGSSIRDNNGGLFTRGVASNGAMTIVNSTISGNSNSGNVNSVGAGVIAIGASGNITIINSTINNNSSPSNGGNLTGANGGTISLSNTIVSNAPSGGNCGTAGTGGTFNSGGNNLSSDSTCTALVQSGDVQNTNPLLDGLAVNPPGGTYSHALLPNSPALDAGNNALCIAPQVNSIDQRGVSRPQFAVCDKGAYEAQAELTVDRSDDMVVNACTSAANDCTLRGAIGLSNNIAGRQTIAFNIPDSSEEEFNEVIVLGSSLTVSDPVDLDATTQPDYINIPIVVLNGVNRTFDGVIFNSTGSFKGFAVLNMDDGLSINASNVLVQASRFGIATTIEGANNNAIALNTGSMNATIGSDEDGINDDDERITILSTAGNGVYVASGSSGNQISRNYIAVVDGLGIELAPDGVNPPNIATTANGGQNAPEIDSVVATGIHFSLDGEPNTEYRIEIFANLSCDTYSSTAQFYMGFEDFTTDSNGDFTGFFDFNVLNLLEAYRNFSATVRNLLTRNTSEITNCVPYLLPSPTPSATNTATFTPTSSSSPTASRTPTNTPSRTPTRTPTRTSTVTRTITPTNTATSSRTPPPPPTNTRTPTLTPTYTPSVSLTPSQTSTMTPTRTATMTPTMTSTLDICDPVGMELIGNGDFSQGTTGGIIPCWTTFGRITWQISGGVFEGTRDNFTPVHPPLASESAILIQNTGEFLPAFTSLNVNLMLGNSSDTRKRISVLAHDTFFTDLQICTFWLEPGQSLTPYSMSFSNTLAWDSAFLSIYFVEPHGKQWARVDDVSMMTAGVTTGVQPTTCTDPTLPPAGVGADTGNLLYNGAFDVPIGSPNNNWGPFDGIVYQITGGVFEAYRQVGSVSAVIVQNSTTNTTAGTRMEARVDLGNSSSTRKRVLLMMHASDFSDFQVCALWVAPGSPLQTYAMRSFAIKNWNPTSFSIYISPDDGDDWLLVDNVGLRQRPALTPLVGVECYHPGNTIPGGLPPMDYPPPPAPLTAPDAPTLEPTATDAPAEGADSPPNVTATATPPEGDEGAGGE